MQGETLVIKDKYELQLKTIEWEICNITVYMPKSKIR